MGLPGLERSKAQGSGMVHAQAADAVVGGGSGAHFAVVDTGRSPSGAVLVDDWEIPGGAWVAGVGSSVGGAGAAVRGRGVAGLFARARESAERGQRGLAAIGADNDDDRLGGNFVEALLIPRIYLRNGERISRNPYTHRLKEFDLGLVGLYPASWCRF